MAEDRGAAQNFLELTETVWRTRAFGDFWSYCMVAEGQVDMAAEPELSLHDMAALVPIVREAGGMFTSLDGRARMPRGQRAGHQRPAPRRRPGRPRRRPPRPVLSPLGL